MQRCNGVWKSTRRGHAGQRSPPGAFILEKLSLRPFNGHRMFYFALNCIPEKASNGRNLRVRLWATEFYGFWALNWRCTLKFFKYSKQLLKWRFLMTWTLFKSIFELLFSDSAASRCFLRLHRLYLVKWMLSQLLQYHIFRSTGSSELIT